MFCRYGLCGKPLKTTRTDADKYNITERNPIRYRSYYYDTETGLCCLNARYYDPSVRRFLNAEPNLLEGRFDTGADRIGYNTYAYCGNNPVKNSDPAGEFVITTAIAAGAAVGFLING